MTDALCSEINHQKYYSGEFDVEWGDTITETSHDFKHEEMDQFRQWLKDNSYDWEDSKLSLGYIKLGQVDLETSFQSTSFRVVHDKMKENLNITKIQIQGQQEFSNDFPYSLESADWKQIQMKGLRRGYESRSVR